ncbi:OTU domain-containing protein [Tanacetum coccineum]
MCFCSPSLLSLKPPMGSVTRGLQTRVDTQEKKHRQVITAVGSLLKSHPKMYKGYIPVAYSDYLKRISKSGEWGDHVTLQAAADLVW